MTISDEDVERYAGFIAGHPEAVVHGHRVAARAMLLALVSDGRLLPAGGISRKEFGLEQHAPGAEGILNIGSGLRAEAHATHQRDVTVWVAEGPNDYWARYVTLWERKPDWKPSQKVVEAIAESYGVPTHLVEGLGEQREA